MAIRSAARAFHGDLEIAAPSALRASGFARAEERKNGSAEVRKCGSASAYFVAAVKSSFGGRKVWGFSDSEKGGSFMRGERERDGAPKEGRFDSALSMRSLRAASSPRRGQR